MALDKIVKSLMEKRGISNKELSEKSGVPLRTINNIIGGITDNPTLETMRAISQALGCTLDDIAEFDDPSDNAPKKSRISNYYLDDEATALAQEIFERPELRMLMDASRKVSKEDLQLVVDMVTRLKGDE